MDELSERIAHILRGVGTQVDASTHGFAGLGRRRVWLKLKSGSQQPHDLTADQWLGIGDDRDLLAEQLKLQGYDVTAVDIPKSIPNKEVLQWADTLSRAFVKAWMQSVNHTAFVQKACECGEGFMANGLHSFALDEVYTRLADRMRELKGKLFFGPGKADEPFDRLHVVSVCVRFQLGRCMCLYQVTTQRDSTANRSDDVAVLRDVLRDIVDAVQFVHDQPVSSREDLYWAVYNACILALRVARWLRLQGFGGISQPVLWWLVQSMSKSLPLVAVHALPFRMTFFEELVASAESLQQFGEAVRYCDEAIQHIEFAHKLETMLPPVPEETSKVFDSQFTRFRVLKIKYEYWMGKTPEPKTKTAWTQAEGLGGQSVAVSCLVEMLQIQHRHQKRFGGDESPLLPEVAVPPASEGEKAPPEVTRLSPEDVQSKQCEIIDYLFSAERLKPLLDKVEASIRELEEFTSRRLAFETEEERRANSDATVGADGSEIERLQEPVLPDADRLVALGFKPPDAEGTATMHTIEQILPTAAHTLLTREALRLEIESGGSRLAGVFKMLEKSLALRLRYRHFLNPPLVDVDVVQTPQRDREKVPLPDKYEFLSEDLNAAALQNRVQEDENAPNGARQDPTKPKPKGELHVFLIGQRYNAWEAWTSEHVVPIPRLCNLRIVFATQPPTGQEPSSHPGCYGFSAVAPLGSGMKPWISPYFAGNPCDSSGFDHISETTQTNDAVLEQLTSFGHVTQRVIPMPIEAKRTGESAGKKSDPAVGKATVKDATEEAVIPYLVFSTFEEKSLWACDPSADNMGKAAGAQQTLLPSDVPDPEAGAELDSETMLPPWCPLLDDALATTLPLTDLTMFTTKHMHASVPDVRYNAMLRVDMRQTPFDLMGRPFQTYIFCCAAADAPTSVCISRQLRLMRALHSLYTAGVAAGPDGDRVPGGGDDIEDAEGRYQRPALMNRLLEISDTLERVIGGPCGALFLFETADFIEDLASYVFLRYLWPKLKFLQTVTFREEVGERMSTENERMDLQEWTNVLRKVLPGLLQVLDYVRTVDALSLGSASFALGKLFMQANDSKSAQAELGKAIIRLEDEIGRAYTQGPQPRLDRPVAACVSFDPPSLRPMNFAMFRDENAEANEQVNTLVLAPLERLEQERICLLTNLYERWVDSCLRVHLKNVNSTIRRAKKPNEKDDEDDHLGPDPTQTKLSLSNPEAAVLTRLGENPYLRCLFFVAVARRRPGVAGLALGKACAEVEAAVKQERQIWAYLEEAVVREQEELRNGGMAARQFLQKKPAGQEKLPAYLPTLYFRSPRAIRLRTPPLPESCPPISQPSAVDLDPAEQDYKREWHCHQLGVRSPGNTLLTCSVFAKASGAGTTVSEMHKELPGTGLRLGGYDFVEIRGLKPNTNYSFAAMFYQGFEATRPAMSVVSDPASPPIGAYYPLPITLLQIEICKLALQSGAAGQPAWKKAWAPLLDSFCEPTTQAEAFDSCGLRSLKLRLDVADRMPSAILAAFAELVVLKHSRAPAGNAAKSESFPATRPAQKVVLRNVNECLLAAESARRAGNSHVTFQSVSLVVKLASRLLRYRTKPQLLFGLLVKCAVLFDAFNDQQQHPLAWHAKTRSMVTYLLHHVSVLCVQLRQVALLSKHVEQDVDERYDAHKLVDVERQTVADKRVLDHALELAMLGSVTWKQAEGKTAVRLKDPEASADIARLLKELSDRNYAVVLTDALQLVIQEQEKLQQEEQSLEEEGRLEEARAKVRRHHSLTALSLLRCAVARAWDSSVAGGVPSVEETLAEVLSKHRLAAVLDRLLDERRNRFLDYGFMLRALPPARMPRTQVKDEHDDPPPDPNSTQTIRFGATQGEEPAQAVDASAPPDEPMATLSRDDDVVLLSHLELMKAAPMLKELQSLRFHWHDITRFKYFDLQQMVEKLPDLEGADDMETTTLSLDETEEVEEADMEEWEVKELEEKKNRKHAFELLQGLLRPLARAAAYASAGCADQMLLTTLIAGLNALLLVGPLPTDCVPPGDKSNPLDVNPDKFVGVPPEDKSEEPASGEVPPASQGETPPPENDIWLNLVTIAQFVVEALLRLKGQLGETEAARPVEVKVVPGPRKAKPKGLDPEIGEEEQQVLQEAAAASKAMAGADEELHDMWFERMPDLDITSIAKFVGFAALCFYRMRRWKNVIALCRDFNDATCSIFATTFMKIAICAQQEICKLSQQAVANTHRYVGEAKKTFEEEQKNLPRKLVRQLKMQGELSEPEKLFKEQSAKYGKIEARQKALNSAWEQVLKSLENTYSLAARVVPLAMEQLKKSRILLAEFLHDRREFTVGVRRGQIKGGQRATRERALRLAAMGLVSSYRKSVELLKKRQMTDYVVQALHELGNLQWLEGDIAGAAQSWSDAVDAVFQYVYAIKNWSTCVETAMTPPQDAARAELMLLTVVILEKYARLTNPRSSIGHLNAALFASCIIECVLTSALPHPSHRTHFTPDRYRMREIFYGFRESRVLLTANSVHGGVDGMTFFQSLTFFQEALIAAGYQQERCIPLCSLYNYVATDVCRNMLFVIRGRLMMARSLLRCRSFDAAWTTLYSISKRHDMPRTLLAGDVLDGLVPVAQDIANLVPFKVSEEQFTERNVQAVDQLFDFVIASESNPDDIEVCGPFNVLTYQLLQVEFLVSVCSFGRVFSKLGETEEACRTKWLEKGDARLVKLWKDATGNDDDIEAWSAAISGGAEASAAMAAVQKELSIEEITLCVEIRLLRSSIFELRGDFNKAVREVLYAMHFFRLLASAGCASGFECGIGGGAAETEMRKHPDAKTWMLLRRRMVHLLVCQGRLDAASASIEQGIVECGNAHDEMTLVELLAAKVRVEVLSGRILEQHGQKRLGAIPAAERCLAVASKHLPLPTPSAVYARMMLCLLLEQNPSLIEIGLSQDALSVISEKSGDASQAAKAADPYEQMLLEAAGRVIISPISRALQEKSASKATTTRSERDAFVECQRTVAEQALQSLTDLDCLLAEQGFQLQPYDINTVFYFGNDDEPMLNTELKLLPPQKNRFRERPASDSREEPNKYVEIMPLRLHVELTLVRVRLDLGDLDTSRRLLQEAELRMARCVYLLPWLYVQYCILKLRWRRLSHERGQARVSVAKDAPNHEKYRDPLAFADGLCPPTNSPLYRTFLREAEATSMTNDSVWISRPRTQGDAALDEFLQELVAVIQISVREGGHDYVHLLSLLREGLEEVLRTHAQKGGPAIEGAVADRIHAIFSCIVTTAEARKALQFETDAPADPVPDPKAAKGAPAGPVPIDVANLPARIALDIQHHLKRQEKEGALAYSPAALQELQKAIPFKTVVRHAQSLRRECDTFASLFHRERLACDQLHVALMQSDFYAKSKVLNEAAINAIVTPSETPTSGDVLISWVSHSLQHHPLDTHCSYFAFICPLPAGEEAGTPPLVARQRVHLGSLKDLRDGLCADLEHCLPADSVTSAYVSQRAKAVARVLWGHNPEDPEDMWEPRLARLDGAVQKLLLAFSSAGAGEAGPPEEVPENLAAEPVHGFFRALIKLLDRLAGGSRVVHPELSSFLRAVLGNFQLPAQA